LDENLPVTHGPLVIQPGVIAKRGGNAMEGDGL